MRAAQVTRDAATQVDKKEKPTVMKGADFLRMNTGNDSETNARDRTGQLVLEVQAEAWDAVQTYGHCTWTIETIVGAKEVRFVYMHITAAEIGAAMNGLRIAREKRPTVLHQIMHTMVPAAKPLLNAAK